MVTKKKIRLKLGEILLKTTSLTNEQLEEAITARREKELTRLLGEILINKGYVNAQDVETALAIQYGFPYISLNYYHIETEICKIIPREFAVKHKLIPLERIGGVLTVAMVSVFDKSAIKQIEEKYGYKVRVFLAGLKEIEEAIRRYY